MRTVHKYPLSLNAGTVKVSSHRIFKPLCVDIQDGVGYLWALVDTQSMAVDYSVHLFETGSPIVSVEGYSYSYIGTLMYDDGEYVLHVFLVL